MDTNSYGRDPLINQLRELVWRVPEKDSLLIIEAIGRIARSNDGPLDESYKAVPLLRAVRDQWYTFTGYSQLKVDIDELLDRLDATKRSESNE